MPDSSSTRHAREARTATATADRPTIIPARPTTYRGTRMRSRLEAGFAMWLDQMGFTWAYEPECFATERGQWLPDFRVDVGCVWHDIEGQLRSARRVYVEVKPASFTVAESRRLRTRMAALHDSIPDAAAVLVQDGTSPAVVLEDGRQLEPLDWTWTGLWPIDARRVPGPWHDGWWRGGAAQ